MEALPHLSLMIFDQALLVLGANKNDEQNIRDEQLSADSDLLAKGSGMNIVYSLLNSLLVRAHRHWGTQEQRSCLC